MLNINILICEGIPDEAFSSAKYDKLQNLRCNQLKKMRKEELGIRKVKF